MGQFSQLTDTELAHLSEHVYRWAIRLYESGEAIMSQMRAMATWTPEYAELNSRQQVIGAAAREQSELLHEIGDLARERAEHREEQARASARLATMTFDDDETWTQIREAQDIDDADRRDDPLMKEH